MATVTVEGCRCCKDRRESHTYEHDLVAMRNAIHGAIYRSEALAAMERLQAAFAERDAQIAEMRKVIKTVRGDLWAQRGDVGCKCVPGSYDCPLHVILGCVYSIDELGLEANDA